jgi:2-succinyl-5-enolpyruvyl-6-hydroxy-3-cyclohexene-1-carboxylate synthase
VNITLAAKTMQDLVDHGVTTFCICAGARNSPFVVLAAAAKGVSTYHFFDERSASFFALGKIQSEGRPVAVITTSGTAVAELLPAVVEASYTQLPLVLVTADRPQRFRGTGAPQTIEQPGIFSKYVEQSLDLASTTDSNGLQAWSQTQPLHLNVCFDEPLIDEVVSALQFSSKPLAKSMTKSKADSFEKPMGLTSKTKMQQPLAIVSGLSDCHRSLVIQTLLRLKIPVYAEALSGLRGCQEIAPLLLKGGEKSVQQTFTSGQAQSVLRIGGVPTLRFWRDLEDQFSQLPVYSISDGEWTGLSRPVDHKVGFSYLETLIAEGPSPLQNILQQDRLLHEKIQALLKKYPRSELALMKDLSDKLVDQSVYLGNSMPIREWDLVASTEKAPRRLSGNRGVNGIDGQISTFLGWSQSGTENWAVIGDLTAMYDLSSLWITRALQVSKKRIVVINNGGGQIFKNIFHNEAFLNRHEIRFEKWAEMFNWDYCAWKSIPASVADLPDHVILEIFPEESETDQFWKEYQSL